MASTLQESITAQRAALGRLIAQPLRVAVERCEPVWGRKALMDLALVDALAALPYARFLYAMDRHGRQLSATASREGLIEADFGRDRVQRPYMRDVLPIQGFLLSPTYISQRAKRPSITAIHVVQQNGIAGFLGADFDLRDLPLTQALYKEPTHWRQIKGDPAIRGHLFAQTRVESQLDRSIDSVLAVVEELICDRGVFHVKIHFSSNRATLWLVDDPYRFRILRVEELMAPDICLAYPRRAYPSDAEVAAEAIRPVLATFKRLRFMDETIYLRHGSLNIFNAAVGVTFSCDGTHYMSVPEFLDKDVRFWEGTGSGTLPPRLVVDPAVGAPPNPIVLF